MRALGRGVERRAAACRVVFGNGVARLHRIDHDAVVDEVERDDARGLGERGVRRLGVAGVVVPVEHDVVGNMLEQLRRAGADRVLGVGHRRQRVVFDLDRLGGIARRGQGLGDDQRHRLADVAHLAERQHRPRRIVPRLAVAAHERHRAGHVAETVGAHVLSRSDEQHARHAPRRSRIDAFDMRMRHRRAQHESLRHPRQHHVVGIAALPGDEPQILMPPHGLADAEFHAVSSDLQHLNIVSYPISATCRERIEAPSGPLNSGYCGRSSPDYCRT